MSDVGSRIKACRIASNLTQDDVAKKLGIGKQAVYKYEIGAVTNIPLDNIEKMAVLFNTTPCYLAGWEETKRNMMIFSDEEIHLIDVYRSADPTIQEAALTMLENSARKKKDTEQKAI